MLALARTLIHLGGVTSTPSPQDARSRLLATSGWLPTFLDDWLRGHLAALSKCLLIIVDEDHARAALYDILLTHPEALFSFGRLDWLAQAVGGGLWLLSLLAGPRREAGGTLVSAPSLKRLSEISGVSRAHYAHLRSIAEKRGLVVRQAQGWGIVLARHFYLQGRSVAARRLAVLGTRLVLGRINI